MLFFFLPFLFYFSISEAQIVVDATTCDESIGFCKNPYKTKTGSKDQLPKCPDTPFQQSIPLVDWILKEIFCVYFDHRETKITKFNNQFLNNSTFDPSRLFDPISLVSGETNTTQQKVYGELLSQTPSGNDKIFIPTAGEGSADCDFNSQYIQYLTPVRSSQCFYTDSPSYQEYFNNLNGITSIQGIEINKEGNVNETEDGNSFLKSLYYEFIVDDAGDITNITLRQEFHENISATSYLLQTNVRFYKVGRNPQQIKSGNYGYATEQPILVTQNFSTIEQYPVPYGIDCQPYENMSYTQLLFGDDTLTGCLISQNSGNITEFLLKYTHISRFGNPNLNIAQDWIEINQTGVDVNCNYLQLHILYDYIGNVYNPQNEIISAKYKCGDEPLNNLYMFSANFFRSSDNQAHFYLQPNPSIGELPDDTLIPLKKP